MKKLNIDYIKLYSNTKLLGTMRQNFYPSLLIYFLVFTGPLLALSGNLITFVFFAYVAITIFYIKHSPQIILKTLYKDAIVRSIIAFLVWSLLMSYWSADPHRSSTTVIKVAFLFFCGFYTITVLRLYNSKSISLNKRNLLWALIIINILIMSECLSHHYLNVSLRKLLHFKLEKMREPGEKATALFTILMPAFYLYLYEKSWRYMLLVLVTILNYFTHNMFAALVAFLIIFITMSLSFILARKIICAMMCGMILLLIYTPIIFTLVLHNEYIKHEIIPHLPITWLQRIYMWENSLILIQEHPICGWGINASDALNRLVPKAQDIIQLHPHNAFIQIWLETGIVGVSIISIIIYQVFLRLLMILNSRSEIAAYISSIAAFFTFSMLSFGAWQSWWLSTFWLSIIVNYLIVLSPAQSNFIQKIAETKSKS